MDIGYCLVLQVEYVCVLVCVEDIDVKAFTLDNDITNNNMNTGNNTDDNIDTLIGNSIVSDHILILIASASMRWVLLGLGGLARKNKKFALLPFITPLLPHQLLQLRGLTESSIYM